MTPKKQITSDEAVQAKLKTALSAQEEYLAELKRLEPMRDVHARVQAARRKVDYANSADELSDAQAALNGLDAESLERGKRRADVLAGKALDKFVSTLPALVHVALERAEQLLNESIEAETQFFSGFDLPHEATTVSRRWKQYMRELAGFSQGFVRKVNEPAPSATPNSFKIIVDWFSDEV